MKCFSDRVLCHSQIVLRSSHAKVEMPLKLLEKERHALYVRVLTLIVIFIEIRMKFEESLEFHSIYSLLFTAHNIQMGSDSNII